MEGTPRNILIADDQENLSFILATSLSNYPNYQVETVNNGEAALEKCRQQLYDLVIADYQLPDMTGVGIARALQELSPETKIILITALSANMILDEIEQENICYFLEKPFALKQFLDAVEETFQNVT